MATEPEPERLEVSDGTDTVVLTSARNGWLVELRVEGDDDVRRQRLLEAATQTVMLEEGGRLELWIEDATPACDRVPLAAGFTHFRDLWRLERPLPAPDTDLATRAFSTADADAFLEVNNRAFHWHPDQSDLTHEELEQKCAEPWFDTDGFRLLELEGRLAGFCWTKVHADETPRPWQGTPTRRPRLARRAGTATRNALRRIRQSACQPALRRTRVPALQNRPRLPAHRPMSSATPSGLPVTRYDHDRAALGRLLGDEPDYRIDQLWQGLYEDLADPAEITTLPASLRDRLGGNGKLH